MKFRHSLTSSLAMLILGSGLTLAQEDKPTPLPDLPPPPPAGEPAVPEDLLGDEHLREEFGVNQFTAPSIKNLFADLAEAGQLPYDKLKRAIPKDPPKDRVRVSLSLGALIADGFLVVHSEKISEFEDVGRAVLKHAKALGSGDRVSGHTKAILENSVGGNWDSLRKELAATQADVEAEMVLLRDFHVAHLISLGGWVRALEIMATAANDPYSDAKAKKLGRTDIVDYFIASLEDLPEDWRNKNPLKALITGITSVRETLEVPEGQPLSPEAVKKVQQLAAAMVTEITKGKG